MTFDIFDRLSAHLKKRKEQQMLVKFDNCGKVTNIKLWLVENFGRLKIRKVVDFRPTFLHHAKYFLEILLMAVSVNCPSFLTN